MKNLILMISVVFYACIASITALGIPIPKYQSFSSSHSVLIGSNSNFILPPEINVKFNDSVLDIQNSIWQLPIQKQAMPIVIKKLSNIKNKDFLSPQMLEVLTKPEGYCVNITKNGILITGHDDMAILHGVTTIQGLIKSYNGKIPEGTIADYPDIQIRTLHFVLRKGTTAQDVKSIIKEARYNHYNTLIIMINNGVKFESMSKTYRENALTLSEFKEVIQLAHENGLEVIPEIKLLTHQEKLLKDKYPSLMYNKVTYNPSNEDTYKIIFPMLDEIINIMHPKIIHIGHDEVIGWNKKYAEKTFNKGEKPLPPELFLQDVVTINNYLKAKNIETWIWGDSLLYKDDMKLDGMLDRHLHGTKEYSTMLSQLPKDVVICDWHYFDEQPQFPSVDVFMNEGHKVLGATWFNCNIYKTYKDKIAKNLIRTEYSAPDSCTPTHDTIRNFSKYIFQHNGEGMIATTWFDKKSEKIINIEIIRQSGEAFWNAK